MASTTLSVTIERSAEDMFAVLTNVDNAPKWSRAIEETMLTPGPMAIGSRRRAVVPTFAGRTTESVMELTEMEPGRRLAMRGVSGFPFDVRIAIDLVSLGTTTRLDWLASFDPVGLLRPLGPIVAGFYKRSFAKDLRNLEVMLETRAL